MINKIRLIILTYICLTSFVSYADSAPSTSVQGSFCSKKNDIPIPGLIVSLVHPQLGRSQPTYTNKYGNFKMSNIPLNETPYYLEAYWGKRLIFRDKILVQGPLKLPKECI